MTKKAPKVDVPDPTPKAVSKSKKAEPVVLTGHENVIDILVEKDSEIDAAEKVMAHVRTDLDPLVVQFREQREAEGEFTKRVHVKGTKANGVYTFADSYAKIDTAVETDLKRLLGEHYTELFSRETEIKVKAGSMDKLLELASKHGFLDLLEKDEYLQPADDFRKKRFDKRSALSPAQNKALDEVVKQVQNRPKLSFK